MQPLPEAFASSPSLLSHIQMQGLKECCLQDGGHEWQHKWMHQLGKLLYITERNRKISAAVASQSPIRFLNPPSNQNDSLPGALPEAPNGSRSAAVGGLWDPSVDIMTQRPAEGLWAVPLQVLVPGVEGGPQGGQKQTVSNWQAFMTSYYEDFDTVFALCNDAHSCFTTACCPFFQQKLKLCFLVGLHAVLLRSHEQHSVCCALLVPTTYMILTE